MNNKKDLGLGLVIGGAVGLLIQPVLANSNAFGGLTVALSMPLPTLRIAIFFFFLALAPVALLVAQFAARFLPVIYQIAKFAAVGTLNSFIDLGLFNLIGMATGTPDGGSIKFIIMKSATFFAATTNSFFWNRLWTFGDKSAEGTAGKAVKFYLVTIINWLVNVGVATGISAINPENSLWVNVVSPICGIFAGMAGNFLGYKFIVFKGAGQQNGA